MDAYRKERLMQIALEDFDKFCTNAGVDFKQLEICIEKGKGRSAEQISRKLNCPRSTVSYISKKCFKQNKCPN